jgi:hypothetical protein
MPYLHTKPQAQRSGMAGLADGSPIFSEERSGSMGSMLFRKNDWFVK